jgi:A/G-specific adenine glycosylase
MNELNRKIISWYEENKRDLPWRNTTPWGVLVSEFMLQQTPVSRVLPKWIEWMERWPTPHSLSRATPGDAIHAWGRLGYPRRALRLYELALKITNEFNGEVPRNEKDLRSLPGVGEYTAAAISTFAFKNSALVLDINIRRFYSRALDGADLSTNHITNVERTSRQQLIPSNGAHTWAAATMEFGALMCTSRNPKCDACPISEICLWRANGYPALQVEKKKQGWHGTNRKCRGTVVQALRESSSLTESALKTLWNDDSQVEKALQTLISDGLISLNLNKSYSLPKVLSQ